MQQSDHEGTCDIFGELDDVHVHLTTGILFLIVLNVFKLIIFCHVSNIFL